MKMQTASHPHRRIRPPRLEGKGQGGVVLVVVLVLLVMVTFMSVSVMRSSLGSDLLTNNNRMQTLAMEVAQTALRFCENDLRKTSGAVLFTDNPQVMAKATSKDTMAWTVKNNWVGGAPKAKALSADQLKSEKTPIVPSKMPECMAEFDPQADGVVVVTARGFSPDYTEDADTKTLKSGSVVWLQSRFLFGSVTP
ncbi:MAG: hypothetical protein QM742_15255 [Aquabacterium sp.]